MDWYCRRRSIKNYYLRLLWVLPRSKMLGIAHFTFGLYLLFMRFFINGATFFVILCMKNRSFCSYFICICYRTLHRIHFWLQYTYLFSMDNLTQYLFSVVLAKEKKFICTVFVLFKIIIIIMIVVNKYTYWTHEWWIYSKFDTNIVMTEWLLLLFSLSPNAKK